MEYATEILQESPYGFAYIDIKNDNLDVLYFNHAFKEMFPKDMPKEILEALKENKDFVEFQAGEKPLKALISYNYGKAVVWIKDNTDTMLVKKEAEAVAKAKSSFLATMSHEIRSPMQSIYGFLELIEEEDVNKHVAEMVSTARKSASGLLEILDDILDLAKVEAGKIELDNLEVPIRTLTYGVIECMEVKLKNKKVSLIADVEDNVPFVVMGDPTRLRQILLNLTSNAVKFTQRGSITVRITTRSQKIFPRNGNGLILRFEVTDTGIGMGPEVQKKIFTPFTQADNATTRKYGGTGLGLSICQKMVALMGGEIGFDSAEGKGTTFWFEVPTVEAREQNLVNLPNLEGLAVLSIEDHPKGAKEILTSLTHMGADVTSVGTYEEGLDLINKRPFDVVICDQGLPDGTGINLLKEAIKIRPFMGQILYTVLDDINIQYSAKNIGAKYLSKPASRIGLGEAVKNAAKQIANYVPDKPRKLIIAEDTPAVQDVIRMQLDKLGVKADFVENGLMAYEILRRKQHDIIITDLHMPVMDGYELASKLREDEKADDGIVNGRLPIIALTADVQISQKQSYLAYGFDECLLKPVSLGQLKQMLVRWGVITEKGVAEDIIEEPPRAAIISENEGLPPALNKQAVMDQFGIFDDSAIEMLKMFVKVTAPLLQKIETSFEAKNNNILREEVHSLKGAARSACCTYLGDLSSDIQNLLDNNQEVSNNHIKALQDEFDRVSKEIAELKIS